MSEKTKEFFRPLTPTDISVVWFYLFLSLLNLVYHARVEEWLLLIGINIAVIAAVIWLARLHAANNSPVIRHIRYWYPAPMILLTFKELYLMIKPIRGIDYDNILIQIDRWIFGTDPTHALYAIATPLLTEFLQIVYATFYFLPMILAMELIRRERYTEGHYVIFATVYGFFISYIGYFLVPAIGPRFTLHVFEATNSELPGLFLTNFLREIINTGESVPAGTLNPAQVVQRDVFPSGHTMMTAIVMYLAVVYRVKSRNFLLICGTLLIFSTVYLRYHYAIDVIAGLGFMAFSLITGHYIFTYWNSYTNADYTRSFGQKN